MNKVEHVSKAYLTSLNNPSMSLTHILNKTKADVGVDIEQWCNLYFGVSCQKLFITMASGTLPPFVDFARTGYQWTYTDNKQKFRDFYDANFDVMNKAGYTPRYCVFVLDNSFIVPVRDSEGVMSIFTTDVRFPHPAVYSPGWPHQTLGDGAQRLVKAHISSVLMDAVEDALRH